MEDTILNTMRERLESDRAELIQRLEKIGRPKSKDASDYETSFPEHGDKPEENATEVSDFQDNLALERDLESTLGKVDLALERIKAGTYGTCIDCGADVSKERLEVLPYARRCMTCHAK